MGHDLGGSEGWHGGGGEASHLNHFTKMHRPEPSLFR